MADTKLPDDAHPGERLKIMMEENEKAIRPFAAEVGVSISGLCNFLYGRTGATAQLAVKLEKAGYMTAEQWLWAQAIHDLAVARGGTVE